MSIPSGGREVGGSTWFMGVVFSGLVIGIFRGKLNETYSNHQGGAANLIQHLPLVEGEHCRLAPSTPACMLATNLSIGVGSKLWMPYSSFSSFFSIV